LFFNKKLQPTTERMFGKCVNQEKRRKFTAFSYFCYSLKHTLSELLILFEHYIRVNICVKNMAEITTVTANALTVSRSPFGETFSYALDEQQESARLADFIASNAAKRRKTVVVQGLGFVGTAMVAAVSNATDASGDALYNVIGVDVPHADHYWKIARVNKGLAPVVSTDTTLDEAYCKAHERGNVTATHSPEAYRYADIVVVDIHLDINKQEYGNPRHYRFSYDGYLNALRIVAEHIREHTLVIIETTVPPGTTEKILKPMFTEVFERRGLDVSTLRLAHSYERVMPGKEYLHSITHFYRVYSGVDAPSKQEARKFLESFINTQEFPLTELHSTTASEMSKVLENSFRAANIAFIQEWTAFADAAGVNLFDVIQAIRVRPTHRNIMAPGLGVGGYCLTKDSLLADWAYTNLFGSEQHLNVSLNAIGINDTMPEYTFERICQALGGSGERGERGELRGKHVTILGVSYLNDVADTRYSPTETLATNLAHAGAVVQVHDPLVAYWAEQRRSVETNLEALSVLKHDVAVFAVRHSEYLRLSAADILRLLPGVRLVVDTMNMVSDATAQELAAQGVKTLGIGKGHWNYAERW
jgi:nucleotide sugar dehydrogenase